MPVTREPGHGGSAPPHPLVGKTCRVKGKHDKKGKVARVVEISYGPYAIFEGDGSIGYATSDLECGDDKPGSGKEPGDTSS